MRQLLTMARARQKDEWSRMSNLLALVYNVNRGADSPRLMPDDFTPFGQEQKRESAEVVTDPKRIAEIFRAMAVVVKE